MQKDGKLIEQEDFSKLYDQTFKSQNSQVPQSLTDRCKTFSKLKEKRKKEAREFEHNSWMKKYEFEKKIQAEMEKEIEDSK